MRAIWQERAAAAAAVGAAAAMGPCALFFGCRNAAADWLFRDEVVGAGSALETGALTLCEVAFSRPRAPAGVGGAVAGDPSDRLDGALSTVLVIEGGFSDDGGLLSGVGSGPVAHELAIASGRHDPPGRAKVLLASAATAAAAEATAAGASPGGGRYVQHRIADEAVAQTLASWILDHGAHIFVSGSARRMPADVAAALSSALVTGGGLDAEAADKYITAMDRSRRLIVEAWS